MAISNPALLLDLYDIYTQTERYVPDGFLRAIGTCSGGLSQCPEVNMSNLSRFFIGCRNTLKQATWCGGGNLN